jgi:mTERF domain-containing protein, mitochondrial
VWIRDVLSKEDVSKKIELLHNIGFSPDDALVTVRKAPLVLRLSDEKIRRVMDFLTKDVGLETPYLAQRPALLMYSLEKRLLPRHFLLKVLREKGFLNVELSYYSTAVISEKLFVKKFVLSYKDHVPGLTDDYASMCSERICMRLLLTKSELDGAKV